MPRSIDGDLHRRRRQRDVRRDAAQTDEARVAGERPRGGDLRAHGGRARTEELEHPRSALVDFAEQAELAEVLVGREHELVVMAELGLVAVALGRRPAVLGARDQRQRILGAERGVADDDRVGRVGDVDLDVADVPVGSEHDGDVVDLLDDHVVQEDLAAVGRARVVDHVDVLLERELEQVEVGDEHRVARVGDVEDVDVGELGVVDDHGVRLGAVLPDVDRVGAVGHRQRILGCGRERVAVHVVGRAVAEALHEDLRSGRVADVVEVEAADAVGRAGLVVDGQHVTLEARGVERDRVRALAVVGARQRRHERELLRVRGVGDVDGEEAAALAGGLRPRREIRRVLVDRHVRDLTRHQIGLSRIGQAGVGIELERVGRLELELGDQLDVLTRRRKVIAGRPVLGREAAPGPWLREHARGRRPQSVGEPSGGGRRPSALGRSRVRPPRPPHSP